MPKPLQHEERIQSAVEALRSGETQSIRKAAAAFDVPRATLQERVKGGATRQQAQVKNRKLHPTEEAALIQWIESLDDRGMSPTISYIRQMADLLLRERGNLMLLDASIATTPVPAMTVGENWVHRLLDRHPHLKTKYSRKYDYQRALCEDPEKISAWFARVQKTINEYGVLGMDIYNFDETGFQMGVASTSKVVLCRLQTRIRTPSPPPTPIQPPSLPLKTPVNTRGTVPAARVPAKGSLEERAGAAVLQGWMVVWSLRVLRFLGQPARKMDSEARKWDFEHGLVKRTGFCLRLLRGQPIMVSLDPLGVEEKGLQVTYRNAVLHLTLFVPWERFQAEPADDIPGLWRSLEGQLGARIRSHVQNIALLRVSADDARADRKLQGLEQENEDVVDGFDFEDREGDDDGVGLDGGGIDPQDHYEAFLDVLSTIQGSEIKDMTATSALRRLDEEARAVDPSQDDNNAAQRGRHFYTMLQDLQDSPFRGMGLPSREEIDAVLKVQKKEDSSVTAKIQGRQTNPSSAHAGEPHGSPRLPIHGCERSPEGVGPGGQMRLELGRYATYVDVALGLTRHWTLNKLQSMAVLLPAAFLDERGTRLQEEGGRQHFQYIGGEGGTGKSRVIHAIKDMFRLKDGLHTLLLTGASGNAAALIGGVTLHSAANIGFEGRAATTKNISEEEKLRWKNMIMLVINEISQVGGLTLAAVDSRLKQYRDDQHRPFGGIPMVMFFGDFFQFDPVLQTSLLLPTPRDPGGQRPDSSAKHLAAHKLFLQFTNVVILREQVRAAGCPRLRGFLRRLRSGEQTELDFQRLSQRVYTPSCESSFVDGLRAITPLNQDRWDLNMAAVVQWARAHGKHISIFVAKHDTDSGKRLSVEELCRVLRYGDDSQLPTPGLFFYAQGMPVVVTRNQFVGLQVVNGAPFKAVDIFPDLAAGTIALASDVTLHLGPPVAVLLQSDDSAGLAILGLPNGTILIKSKTVAIPSQMRGKEGRWRGKPGFRRVTHRTGPFCTPAFAMTDQKSQGKQFSDVLVNLKGVHFGGTATRPSFMSLYVQLSRAQSWDGLHLFRKPARGDFIEPKNVLDKDMKEAILKLERQGEETRRRFEQDHRHEP
ncbi:hypothetical protein CHGG_00745 [Chaetomium globosum CBS 148.51]|uniref:ATP-dependent DNA helicase n=1 Tax=Chaetomium globosum (strain ATCC 6205 / CBS 148.51 / DSM 1962 / NBRC 6347 / NRRL 1970) TaxID=306901 RepID=Q2HGA9_CHAGB|nr:uncharacterized protein CHGG_00745 [Chaetomium globosum CBS 148.51]EAQ92510.1 hypothetical protein CHGG_00745 [Chaetomium globosum CBS 148.51]